MAQKNYPLTVNGVITDWSQTELSFAKLKQGAASMPPIRGGFTKLDFEYSADGRENQLGNAIEPVGQNQGSMSYTASFECFEVTWKKLLAYLGNGFMNAENQLTLTTVYKIDGKTQRVSIRASISGVSAGFSQGASHLRTVTLSPISIRETDANGNEVSPT